MRSNVLRAAVAATMLVLLGGCAAMFSHGTHRNEHTSSLVDYLYPGAAPPVQDAVPVLHLPLTVGVAFLPAAPGYRAAVGVVEKQAVLQAIRERFESRGFVREIVPIPDYYLTGQKGFDGLASLQRLYKLDLIALVSYDQVARQDANQLSLTYLTIVGQYLFPGTSQGVNSMVDLAVVHPATRSLVLRAAGMDSRKGVTTEAGSATRLQARSVESFNAAAASMIDNFDTELLGFEDKVRKGTARVRIANPGAGGGGALDGLLVVLLVVLLVGSVGARARGRGPGDIIARKPGDLDISREIF